MKYLNIVLAVLALILIGLFSYAGLYYYSAKSIEFRDAGVSQLRDISFHGAVIDGTIILYNPGYIDISSERIYYEIYLESGQRLASGNIYGGELPAGQSAGFDFTTAVDWGSALDLAQGYLSSSETNILINGTVLVKDIGVARFQFPFERKVDISPYLDDYIQAQAGKAAESIGPFLENVLG